MCGQRKPRLGVNLKTPKFGKNSLLIPKAKLKCFQQHGKGINMKFYSTFIGDEKVCFAWAGDIGIRVSNQLWAIGEGQIRNFFVLNQSISDQCLLRPGQPVFYTQFLVEGFPISQFIKQSFPFSFRL